MCRIHDNGDERGTIVGRLPYQQIILDDPHAKSDLSKEEARSRALLWFRDVFPQRLNSDAKVIVIPGARVNGS